MSNEWISIDKQLPEILDAVLIVWKGAVQNITYELHTMGENVYVFVPHFFGDDDIGEMKFEDVTHWQQLPDPPTNL